MNVFNECVIHARGCARRWEQRLGLHAEEQLEIRTACGAWTPPVPRKLKRALRVMGVTAEG